MINANIDKIYIVTGYKSEIIKKHVKNRDHTTIIENDRYETTDNAYSLFLALMEVNLETDSVVVLDGDIIFDLELLRKLVNSEYQNVMIVDDIKIINEDDCKVRVRNGYAVAIGKHEKGQTVYTSMIKMGGQFLNSFKKEIQIEHSLPEWYSQPLNRLIIQQDSTGKNEMNVICSGDLDRCEIDTVEDYLHARNIYKKICEKQTQGGTFK